MGDCLAQAVEGQGSELDVRRLDKRRLLLYTSFTNLVALVYDRPIYVLLLPRLFPTFVNGRRVWSNVLKATLLDNFVMTPFLYFPLFYIFKDCIVERTQPSPLGALTHCAAELQHQLLACWAFWVPVTGMSQAFVPVHLRIPFFSVSAVGWIGLLSARTAALDARSAASRKQISGG